jgi:hypothetical protein
MSYLHKSEVGFGALFVGMRPSEGPLVQQQSWVSHQLRHGPLACSLLSPTALTRLSLLRHDRGRKHEHSAQTIHASTRRPGAARRESLRPLSRQGVVQRPRDRRRGTSGALSHTRSSMWLFARSALLGVHS